MIETDDRMKTNADADDDVVVYVPKKKTASKFEYIDDEGVRVVSDEPRPGQSKKAPASAEPSYEPTRRMAAVKTESSYEPTRRMTAAKSGAEPREEARPVAVARRERGKTTDSRSKKRKARHTIGKIPTAILTAGAAAIVIVVLTLVFVFSGTEQKETLPAAATMGFLDDGGVAYAPLYNGEAVSAGEDAAACVLSPDRKNLVIQRTDGSIAHYDHKKALMIEICADAKPKTGIAAVRNSGILYFDSEKDLHRFSFEDGADVNVGCPANFAVAKNTLSLLYPSGDKLCILPEGKSEPVEAGGYSGTPKTTAVSDDGQCAVWTDWSNNAQNIYLYDSRGRAVLETLVGTTAPTRAVFSGNGSFLTVINPDSESAYLWNRGTVSRAKLGAVPAPDEVYTVSGPLGQDNGEVGGVYIHVSSSAGGSVFYIDLMGEREKLLSKVKSFRLSGGTACFTTNDGSLYYAAVSGANASERVRVTSDVQDFLLSKDGQYIYYLKDISAGLGTLYVYHIGDEEPEKIASEVYNNAYVACENSSSLIYYKEPEKTNVPDTRIGEMYLYSFGNGSNKIASDCVIGRVSSGSEVGRIDEESFMYLRYLSSESGGKVYSNCVYYDGRESRAVLKDVYYDAASTWKLK